MKRILFVDDEPRILEGLRDLLRRNRKRWEMSFALGAEAALAELAHGHFDVVVTDMRMPYMDGALLLARVKESQPSAVRIILSGHAEREAAIRAVPVAHQFLSKPCDGATLEMAIDHACGGAGLISDEHLRDVIGATFQLPSLSKTLSELLRVLDSPNASAADLVDILERDPAMSAKTLQLVNSAFFGLPRRVSSIRQAVVYLGIKAVRASALGAEAFTVVKGVSESLIRDVQRTGILSSHIARSIAGTDSDEASTAAMLQDVGQLLIAARLPEEAATVRRRSRLEGLPIHLLEQEVLGATHAQIGAHLLAMWGLPEAIVQAVAFSHTTHRMVGPDLRVAAIAQLSNCLAREVYGDELAAYEFEPSWLASFGFDTHLDTWRDQAAALARLGMAA